MDSQHLGQAGFRGELGDNLASLPPLPGPAQVWCIRLGSILLALALGALVMGLVGANPFTAYGAIVSGALGKKTAIRQTVKIAVRFWMSLAVSSRVLSPAK